MAEPFCEFGGLPESQCGHCRDAQRQRDHLRPLSAAEVQRYVAARYGKVPDDVIRWRYLHDPEYHARVKLWEQIMEAADFGEYGPWIISEFYGRCRGCGEKWEPGEMIRYSEDEGGWVCSCTARNP